MTPLKPHIRHLTAFSMVELLATLGIMAIMMAALCLPVMGWSDWLSRKSAADSVRQALELARIEALRHSIPVGFVYADDHSALDPVHQGRIYQLVRESLPHEPSAITPIPLTAWRSLPDGLVFDPSGGKDGMLASSLEVKLPGGGVAKLPAIVFGPTGSLASPVPPPGKAVGISLSRRNNDDSRGPAETFSVRRLTGRIVHQTLTPEN